MKFGIVGGTGAMGALYASKLQGAGHEVHILGVSQAAISAINTNGLIVTSPDGSTEAFPIPATADAETIGHCDVVIVLVKAHQTEAALRSLPALTGDRTIVLSLQNGWGPADVLARTVAPDQLALGVSYLGATVIAPGRINHTLFGETVIGPFRAIDGVDWLIETRDALAGSGLGVTLTASVQTEIWKKLILNSAALPISALTHLRTGAIGGDEEVLQLCEALMREATSVAIAGGIEIDADERISYMRSLLSRGGAGKPSMLQDVEAQRLTEIDVINGAIVRLADSLGIDAPLHRAMVTLIHGRERSWS